MLSVDGQLEDSPADALGVMYVLAAPVIPGRGFLFATIRGELHEIHAAVSALFKFFWNHVRFVVHDVLLDVESFMEI